MMMIYSAKSLWFFLFLMVMLRGFAQEIASPLASRLVSLDYSNIALLKYRTAVLGEIVKEANHIAIDLELRELKPITMTNVVSTFVPPPQIAKRLGAIGNITTQNYTYYFSVSNKFSFLTVVNLQNRYREFRAKYFWPIERLNTNAALEWATHEMQNAHMDVNSLNRDCDVHIVAFKPEGEMGSHFIPVYWVYWSKRDEKDHGSVGLVEFLSPTAELLQLRVEDSQYILRDPILSTNIEDLLLETNSAAAYPGTVGH